MSLYRSIFFEIKWNKNIRHSDITHWSPQSPNQGLSVMKNDPSQSNQCLLFVQNRRQYASHTALNQISLVHLFLCLRSKITLHFKFDWYDGVTKSCVHFPSKCALLHSWCSVIFCYNALRVRLVTFVWNQAPVLNLECSLSIISQIVQGANEDELNMANVPAALYSFSLHTELWRITLLNIVLTQSGIFFFITTSSHRSFTALLSSSQL